jgi:glycerate-2-kinase
VNVLSAINKINIIREVSANIVETLLKEEAELIPKTPKSENPVFKNVSSIITRNNTAVINVAREKVGLLGYETSIVSFFVTGEAKMAGMELAEKMTDMCNPTNGPEGQKNLCNFA